MTISIDNPLKLSNSGQVTLLFNQNQLRFFTLFVTLLYGRENESK